MNNRQIFELALGAISPWYIEDISLPKVGDQERELHIHLNFEPGSTFVDEYGESCKAYDTARHTWRHLNFFQYKCFLHAPVPRITDSKGSIKKVVVPWARRNNGFTLLFESHIMMLIQLEMTVSSVAKLVDENSQRIWHTFSHYVKKAKAEMDDSGITSVGIDETSKRKGHDYITVGVDLQTHRVFKVVEGKDASAVAELAEHLEENGSDPLAVEKVCIDMSRAFISGVGQSFPNAQVSFDRFHIAKEVNKAMDVLRKAEQQEFKAIKGYRYIFLKNKENLSKSKLDDLYQMIKLYPRLGEGYRLKSLFRELWDFKDPRQAKLFLVDWCKQALDSGIIPFQKLVGTIRAHWDGIVNAVKSQINNGVLEGINSKIQLAKKRARGYRNVNNFINMIYFLCGKLNFAYPHSFT
jgi:transposase